jgi:hypothetical protein
MRLEAVDNEDCKKLMEQEIAIARISAKLGDLIIAESELELILIDKMRGNDIRENLSIRNKFIELKRVTRNEEVNQHINDYFRTCAEVKKHRDSLKKIISIKPN